MNKKARGFFFLGVLILLVLSFVIILKEFLPSVASNTILDVIESPNLNYSAYVFVRDAGATTGYSYQVSVLDADEELSNKSGNVFIIDAPDYDPNNYLELPFSIYWSSNYDITIKYNNNYYKTYKQKNKVGKIKIIYE